ncbi:hypothetical protein D0Z07_2032 [Hyphodiscus hymeniophilus]|uniref:Uncharacterized protein n=1 Tax=Hyphodiscus hymeniophilus TaxID=353542 RepID=A0A9P7B014_9HELO|nr:hypothetical protein D0Z07_2032 [Hyphodiscus hymeniophilus]
MDLDTDNDVLQNLADGQLMDYAQWPGLLSRIIVREDFPIPPVPPPITSSQTLPSFISQSTPGETSSQNSTTSNQSTNKENDPPPVNSMPPGTLPPQIQVLLTSITTTLTTLFQTHPPHTIQRLAELVLHPKQHYRSLPSYLHAVDRVVHVTSGAHIFPLPPAIPDPSSAAVLSNGSGAPGIDPLSISWGNPATAPAAASLDSDESLGGALLTPIMWLSNKNGTHSPLEGEVKTESTEMIDGPNGLGGVETVTVSVNGISSTRSESSTAAESAATTNLRAEGGVTQGELLRQEQLAGVVPVAQLEGHRGNTDGMGEEDEVPHARGPQEIGMEDMGPQNASGSERAGPGEVMQGIDVEAAVGRKIGGMDGADDEEARDEKPTDETAQPATPKREAEEEIGGEEKRLKEEVKNEDVELVDADGKAEEETKVGEKGENRGADAVDTTSI